MSKQRLAELLQQLREELTEADDIDAEVDAWLRTASREIEDVLARDATEADTKPPDIEPKRARGLIAQFREAADRFEDSHPALTNTVGRIADALAQLGI